MASSTPGMSSRCRGRPHVRHEDAPSASTTTPIGRFTKKIQRQSNAVTSSPPSVGPAIVATPATAPQMPNAAPRRSGGNTVVMIASVCGISMRRAQALHRAERDQRAGASATGRRRPTPA